MQDLNNKFSNIFGKFETYIKSKYGVNELSDEVFEKKELKKNKEFWKKCRALRNIYSHGGIDFADINPKRFEEFCMAVNKVMRPKSALEIGIRESNVYKVTVDEPVNKVISIMLQKNYTRTPIIDNTKKVIGVFSADSFMIWADKKGEIAEDFKTVSIGDVMDYCKLDGNEDITYKFASKETKEDEIREMFKVCYEKNQRLETIFITNSGNKNEGLLGIVTHWDLC